MLLQVAKFHLFYDWVISHFIYKYAYTHTHTDTHTPHILFIHLLTGMWVASIIGYCKSCCTVCISFQISVCILFRYIPRSGIDGLYVSSIFWENFTLFSIVAAPTYNSTNSIPRFPFPGGSGGKESTCKCWRPRFDPWVRMITRRREWWPTPVFSPREFPEQRSLEGYSPPGSQRGGHDWLTNTFTFSTSYPTFIICRLFDNGHFDVWGDISVLLCISLISDVEHFSCAYWPSVYLWGNVEFFCPYLIGHLGSFDIELILPVDRSWMVHIKEQVCATRPSCPVLSSSFWYGHPSGMTSLTFPFLVSFPECCVQVLFTIPCTIIVYSMYHY